MRHHMTIRHLLPWLLVLLLVPAGVVAGQRATPAPDCPPVATTPVTLGDYELHGNVYTFAGTGSRVSEPFTLHQGLAILSYKTVDEVMSFDIESYPAGVPILGSIILTTPTYPDGVTSIRIDHDGQYIIGVTSVGSWEIAVGQP
jgi:hypothetical protein